MLCNTATTSHTGQSCVHGDTSPAAPAGLFRHLAAVECRWGLGIWLASCSKLPATHHCQLSASNTNRQHLRCQPQPSRAPFAAIKAFRMNHLTSFTDISGGPLAYVLLAFVLLVRPCSQVAGLPPVTKDWFEARKAQLSTAAAAPHTKIWYDPLTKKKFQTQQTYQVGPAVQAALRPPLVFLTGCLQGAWGFGGALGGWRDLWGVQQTRLAMPYCLCRRTWRQQEVPAACAKPQSPLLLVCWE